ncbi:hypothetical protein GWR56_15470 [Mucilaginibacter sp. 14171R-50]|uniref:SPW repeat domain-containing protein n=1 Tax=Mucilaginibacter sp. 14171R-50 TaxID=2703789 RepID=UPI00138CB9A5|nr:hypothetical protein [Mucilaginibacter sp. 14171R-50]QHS56875.1 hypothetical protein GWR56_15470 [Mucilaginibacter sp. 14171R-50]
MKPIISLKAHGILDYVGGLLITFSPWIFGFAKLGGAPLYLPLCMGSMQLVMAIFSTHPYGIFKAFPMQLHLVIDMIVGIILIAAPWIYGFYHFVFLPHLLLGLVSFFAGLLTQHSPLYRLELFDERGYR